MFDRIIDSLPDDPERFVLGAWCKRNSQADNMELALPFPCLLLSFYLHAEYRRQTDRIIYTHRMQFFGNTAQVVDQFLFAVQNWLQGGTYVVVLESTY